MPKTLRRSKENRRERSVLSRHLEKALSTYTLAGSAALATVCATPVQGEVHYTLAKISGTGYGIVSIDLNHDGVVDFTLDAFDSPGIDSGDDRFFAYPPGQNGIAVTNGSASAQPLNFGQEIGPNLLFAHGSNEILLAYERTNFGFSQSGGEFIGTKNKFLGLQLSLNGKIYYGWARVDVKKANKFVLTYEVVDYAYQDRPGVPILAGEGIRQGNPFALGALALGNAGLPLLRAQSPSGGF